MDWADGEFENIAVYQAHIYAVLSKITRYSMDTYICNCVTLVLLYTVLKNSVNQTETNSGQVSLRCSILLRTQLLYNLPLLISDISLLVSNGTNCLNLFHPMRILASTAASASPSTRNISPRWQNLSTTSRFALYDLY